VDKYPPDIIVPDDAFLLCVAPVPRDDTIHLQLDAHATISAEVDSACGADAAPDSRCTLPLPDACLQPL